MALTGIQILKMLPKTNCGECNIPTCLALAMKGAEISAKVGLAISLVWESSVGLGVC